MRLSLTLLIPVWLVGAANAGAASCRISGTVIESTPEHLVLESQNERIRFTHSHGADTEFLDVRPGDRVTVEYAPAAENAGEILHLDMEALESPGTAPEDDPKNNGIIDDRAFYSASREDASAVVTDA